MSEENGQQGGDAKAGYDLAQRLALDQMEKAFPKGAMIILPDGRGYLCNADPIRLQYLVAGAASIVQNHIMTMVQAVANQGAQEAIARQLRAQKGQSE